MAKEIPQSKSARASELVVSRIRKFVSTILYGRLRVAYSLLDFALHFLSCTLGLELVIPDSLTIPCLTLPIASFAKLKLCRWCCPC
ncbi:hypothetical protein [Tianweitania aestuarii]|uniref:hypothetical protein n=1 Tax=Tianweitania aestuarii TaxID=2814886 RepID=UPI003D649CA6